MSVIKAIQEEGLYDTYVWLCELDDGTDFYITASDDYEDENYGEENVVNFTKGRMYKTRKEKDEFVVYGEYTAWTYEPKLLVLLFGIECIEVDGNE